MSLGKTLRQIEQDAIIAALSQHGGNRGEAAKSLGIPKRTLSFKLKRMREEGLAVPPPAAPVPPARKARDSECEHKVWIVHVQPGSASGPEERTVYCDACWADRLEE